MKHPILTTIFSFYGLVAVILALKIFNVIHLSWLILASPFLIGLFIFVVYIATLLIWSYIHHKREMKRISEEELNTETSFFCHGCARPFDKPVKHLKGESIYHKHCTTKQR